MIKAYQQFDLWGKKIFEKAIIEPPFRIAARMPNEACFYYVVRGDAKVFAPTETIRRQADEGLVMQCGNYLNDYLADEEGDYCEAIAVHFYPEVLKMIYDKELPDFLLQVKKVKPFGYQRVKATTLIKNYIDNLQFYFDNPELVSDELLKLKLKELILLLAKTNDSEALYNLLSSLFSEQEFSFKEVVEANIYNNLSLEELAALTHLSLSSFKRAFAKHYQEPPAKYIKKRKLQKAAKLLKGTSLRISDVAFDCGFVDLAHFSRSFQKEYGFSPSNYRLD